MASGFLSVLVLVHVQEKTRGKVSHRLEQAICNEPHDEEDKVEGEAQEKNVEWWTEENGIHNTDRRDNHGVDKPSIHMDPGNAEVVGEPGKEAEDNHRAGQLQESE